MESRLWISVSSSAICACCGMSFKRFGCVPGLKLLHLRLEGADALVKILLLLAAQVLQLRR